MEKKEEKKSFGESRDRSREFLPFYGFLLRLLGWKLQCVALFSLSCLHFLIKLHQSAALDVGTILNGKLPAIKLEFPEFFSKKNNF
jgi:hypothetical protein